MTDLLRRGSFKAQVPLLRRPPSHKCRSYPSTDSGTLWKLLFEGPRGQAGPYRSRGPWSIPQFRTFKGNNKFSQETNRQPLQLFKQRCCCLEVLVNELAAIIWTNWSFQIVSKGRHIECMLKYSSLALNRAWDHDQFVSSQETMQLMNQPKTVKGNLAIEGT